MDMQTIWIGVGFILTLMVFSYLLGDNILFRLVTYLFVGVSAGYVFILVLFQVIIPRLIAPLTSYGIGELALFVVIPLILSTMLLFKISPRLAGLGTLPMAYLVGVGAAVAIGGAVFGTLTGQVAGMGREVAGAVDPLDFLGGLIILVGAVCTLAYFQFSARTPTPGQAGAQTQRGPLVEALARIGQVFVGLTLGALFAGVYAAALTALMERIGFIFNVIANFTTGG
jgi:hypothetical protein